MAPAVDAEDLPGDEVRPLDEEGDGLGDLLGSSEAARRDVPDESPPEARRRALGEEDRPGRHGVDLDRGGELFEATWEARAVPNFNLAIPYVLLGVAAAGGGAGLFFLTASVSLAIGLAAVVALFGVTALRSLEAALAVALYYYTVEGDRGLLPEHMLRFAYVPPAHRGRWPRAARGAPLPARGYRGPI